MGNCRYSSGEEVRLGDRVRLGTLAAPPRLGRVTAIIERGEFEPEIPEQEWAYLQKGLLVEFDDGNLIHYEIPEDDLELLDRA